MSILKSPLFSLTFTFLKANATPAQACSSFARGPGFQWSLEKLAYMPNLRGDEIKQDPEKPSQGQILSMSPVSHLLEIEFIQPP